MRGDSNMPIYRHSLLKVLTIGCHKLATMSDTFTKNTNSWPSFNNLKDSVLSKRKLCSLNSLAKVDFPLPNLISVVSGWLHGRDSILNCLLQLCEPLFDQKPERKARVCECACAHTCSSARGV